MEAPLVVIGLGNPGSTYEAHRHNAGSLALQGIEQYWRFPSFVNKKSFEFSAGLLEGCRVFLLRPLTFMNDSGRAVGLCANFYKLSSEAFLVLHDDIDLSFGTIKLKHGGGNGGHNGLRSIDSVLGPSYWRLRIGIGHPGHKGLVVPYVLSPFSKGEKEVLASIFVTVAEQLPLFVRGETTLFAQRLKAALVAPDAPAEEEGNKI
ncbi:MAG: aminoacyl-tRNA hydrolase [Holosporales bacterium]|jgi:PTH1 family peptidyl-tRNA hydrolase|nr:aminoacyl-tRNA hydrolase [Holosporales bacterium]